MKTEFEVGDIIRHRNDEEQLFLIEQIEHVQNEFAPPDFHAVRVRRLNDGERFVYSIHTINRDSIKVA